jgi:outer membrane lipase/esterase
MQLKSACAVAVAFVIAASPAPAATVDRFTAFFAFGDSLSDPGNLDGLVRAITGQPIPRPDVVDGRLTNGPVWAEHVAADFARRDLPTANVAFIGANAAADGPPNPAFPEISPLIPSIPQQVALFAQTRPELGHRPVAAFLGGANDLFFGGIGSPDVGAVAREAARGVADSARAVAGLGINDVVLFSLPDLGDTPGYALFQPQLRDEATLGTDIFNATLRDEIVDLRAGGLNVIEIDLNRLFVDLIEEPERFGVSDVTFPCVFPSAAAAAAFGQDLVCSGDLPDARAFWSAVHPNAVIHAEIARIVRQEVAPIPLPLPVLMLLGGMAALVATGRRRAA